MSENVQMNEQEQKSYDILRNSESLYTMISPLTRMPFVICNPETYDDEVLIFQSPEDVQKGCQDLLDKHNPVQMAKLEQAQFPYFYGTLFSMGVNAIHINRGCEQESHLQLNQLMQRSLPQGAPDGATIVENPQLVLTSVYLLQEMRKQPKPEMNRQMKELHEEMMANIERGIFITVQPDTEKQQAFPFLKINEENFFPLFTDAFEFRKFNMENQFTARAINFETASIEAREHACAGFLVNPVGINLQLRINNLQEQA